MEDSSTVVALWAAGVGAIGGIAAAVGGGYLAARRSGKEQRELMRNERRVEIYSRYLTALSGWPAAVKLSGTEREKTWLHLQQMREAEAQVSLVASAPLHEVLRDIDAEFLRELSIGIDEFESAKEFVGERLVVLVRAMRAELGEDFVERPFV